MSTSPPEFNDDAEFLERIRDRIADVIVTEAVDSLDQPHVVACRLAGTDIVTYTGPFPTGMAALVHAEDEAGSNCPGDDMVYSIIALTPPRPVVGRHRA